MMILMYVIALLLTVSGGLVLLWAFLTLRNRRRYHHLPGPPADSFFFGNLPGLTKYTRERKCRSLYFYDRHMEYGFTFKIFALFEPIVITCDPLTVRDLKIRSPKERSATEMYERTSGVGGRGAGGIGLGA